MTDPDLLNQDLLGWDFESIHFVPLILVSEKIPFRSIYIDIMIFKRETLPPKNSLQELYPEHCCLASEYL